jgi:CRP-like cAMP-binding protein
MRRSAVNDVSVDTTNNAILSGLEAGEKERLAAHLTYHNTTLGENLFLPNSTIDYLFFPNNSMISIVGNTRQGRSAEIGVIGKEGVVGVDLLLGAPTMINHVMIQLANGGYRLPAAEALREFKLCGSFHDSILMFVHRLMIQVSQTAVCNALHGLEERLAKWLLMCHDRANGDKLHLTQEFLSFMVGTTRASVTLSAITLQDLGYITYRRGSIEIIDRPSLVDFACDCYKVVRTTNAETN